MSIRNVVIIGSGVAGYTAGIYTSRANLNPLLITGIEVGGQLMLTSHVENYTGFPSILGSELMEKCKEHAISQNVEMLNEQVITVEYNVDIIDDKPIHKIITDGGKEILTKTLIIATGASAKWLGIESESKFLGNGVTACAVCDGMFYKGDDVIVVGGGDTACEEALYLSKICKSVKMLLRTDFKASKIMVDRVKSCDNINIYYDSVISEIKGDSSGVKSVDVMSKGSIINIPVSGVFVAIGHTPNSKIFNVQTDDYGYIKTHNGTRTSVQGVFACGDVQDPKYRQAIISAGSGSMSALDVEYYLNNN